MLIVCNGAIKSGSTWLYNVVTRLLDLSWPPDSYLTLTNDAHPTIPSRKIEAFLALGLHQEAHYVSKNHYGRQEIRDLLLADSQVRVIDMTRDLRDVIVSAYYDACRRNGFEGSFETYYWRLGRGLADQLSRYHALWGDGHPQVFVTSFETLKTDFRPEVARLAAFLDLPPNPEKIAEIEQETHIDRLRKKYSGEAEYATEENPFFRKGEIGDWRNHFGPKLIADLERVERHGLSPLDRVELANRARRKLARLTGKRA
ncbi:MAG: sulfotransferase domain-containing protein [Pseudomonadota bacterium]